MRTQFKEPPVIVLQPHNSFNTPVKVEDSNRYTFSIYLHVAKGKPHKRKANLRYAFVRRMSLSPLDLVLQVENISPQIENALYTDYTVHLEKDVVEWFKQYDMEATCIVSFQSFYDGERIAVARLLDTTRDNKEQG